jgi:hypothetical protein
MGDKTLGTDRAEWVSPRLAGDGSQVSLIWSECQRNIDISFADTCMVGVSRITRDLFSL